MDEKVSVLLKKWKISNKNGTKAEQEVQLTYFMENIHILLAYFCFPHNHIH